MFSEIAPRYDLLNRVLSLGLDRWWRRAAINRLAWEGRCSGLFLDACSGTLDLAAELSRRPGFRGRVLACDFAVPMLRRGLGKPPAGRVRAVAADALRLPLGDRIFDGAVVGFGIRNLADLEAGLAELRRVLRPGARLVLLELATPRFAPLRGLYGLYARRLVPLVGRLVSGHPTAYSYLPESVRTFPAPAALESRIGAAGFAATGHARLSGGIAAIVWGERTEG